MESNRLLAGLSRKDHRQLITACEVVELDSGEVLWEPQSLIRHVYFPLDGFVSQLVPFDSRDNLELSLVGNEGMLGTPLILGVNNSILQALVQGSGTSLRMSTATFRRELKQLPALRQRLNRYIYVLQSQLALTAACISFHSLDLRLARWLLMTHDRSGSGSFHLTHQFLAQMLGVRRVGITNAAGLLQKRELLSYSRGEITILNRRGLEKASCSCYKVSKDAYDRVLG
ncbi:MAG: Crp/Fnr family transcriptional regulator [Woeseia sp.]